jgi:hypothetical protein
MSAVEAHWARAEIKSMPPCKCGQPLVLVTSLMDIRSKSPSASSNVESAAVAHGTTSDRRKDR